MPNKKEPSLPPFIQKQTEEVKKASQRNLTIPASLLRDNKKLAEAHEETRAAFAKQFPDDYDKVGKPMMPQGYHDLEFKIDGESYGNKYNPVGIHLITDGPNALGHPERLDISKFDPKALQKLFRNKMLLLATTGLVAVAGLGIVQSRTGALSKKPEAAAAEILPDQGMAWQQLEEAFKKHDYDISIPENFKKFVVVHPEAEGFVFVVRDPSFLVAGRDYNSETQKAGWSQGMMETPVIDPAKMQRENYEIKFYQEGGPQFERNLLRIKKKGFGF